MAKDLDSIALRAAEAIEDEFARSHLGGVTQRRAKVQCHVLEAITEAFLTTTSKIAEGRP